MQKIPTIFKRVGHDIVDEMVDGLDWLPEATPTRKFDGTACMVRSGRLYKRYEVKAGRVPPNDFEPTGDVGPTGKQPGWVPVGVGPEDKWHREALTDAEPLRLRDGTYELCGPKVQRNPERYKCHVLVQHGCETLDGVPLDYSGLETYLSEHDIEGVVWHHDDGRMAKIKGRDFGLRRRD